MTRCPMGETKARPILLALLLIAGCDGCAGFTPVTSYEDKQRDVTCWVAGTDGISCLPNASLHRFPGTVCCACEPYGRFACVADTDGGQ